MSRVHNYLLTNRKKWALTQPELGALLGGLSAASISQYERHKRHPPRKVLIGCQVLFGLGPRAMFSTLYGEIEEEVAQNAAKLDKKLRGKTDARSQKKLELLKHMTDRIRPTKPDV